MIERAIVAVCILGLSFTLTYGLKKGWFDTKITADDGTKVTVKVESDCKHVGFTDYETSYATNEKHRHKIYDCSDFINE